MDISNLSIAEIEALFTQLSERLNQLRAEAATEDAERREGIEAAQAQLAALLGPEGAAPGTSSIRAVRGYSAQVMGENAGIALELAFTGLEMLTKTVADIAAVIAADRGE